MPPSSCSKDCFHVWKPWGIALGEAQRKWWCSLCSERGQYYYHCGNCLSYCCADCILAQKCGSITGANSSSCEHVSDHAWKPWGAPLSGNRRLWCCYKCSSSEPYYFHCSRCDEYCCPRCILAQKFSSSHEQCCVPRRSNAMTDISAPPDELHSALDMQSLIVAWDEPNWSRRATCIFAKHGFVIVQNLLVPDESQAVLNDCEKAAARIVGAGRCGNRGPGRYSFGVASTTGSMLHIESFAHCLLNNACSKLRPVLDNIFKGGRRPGYVCTGGGGDFVLGGTTSDQTLHSDILVKKEDDVLMPPPFLSINFVVQDLTRMNGPTRIIPGTQLHRGYVPERAPNKWQQSRLYPVPAGAAIVRDARVLHGGTRNDTETSRYLPSVEFVSADFRHTNRSDCFPPWKCLPNELYERLAPQIQELCTEIVAPKCYKLKQSYIMS